MTAGFRNPPVVPTLGAVANASVAQAGMKSMLAPWMGGRAAAVAPITTQAGMKSLLAPWMGGRAAALAVVPPPPPPPPPPAPLSGSSGPGGGGGGVGWYDHDHSLRKLLDAAWERGRLKRALPATKQVIEADSDASTSAEAEQHTEVVHHHHWWITEKEVVVEKPIVVERFLERDVVTTVTKTVTEGVSVPHLLGAATMGALSAASVALVVRWALDGRVLKPVVGALASLAFGMGARKLWSERVVRSENISAETIRKPYGFLAWAERVTGRKETQAEGTEQVHGFVHALRGIKRNHDFIG